MMDQSRTLDLPGTAEAPDLRRGSIFFVGTATVILRYAGFTVLTDPNFLHKGDHVHLGYGLTSRRLTDPAMELDALPPVDFVLLSHLHGDHFDQVVEERLDKDLPIVTTPNAASGLAKKGFRATKALETWASMDVTKGESRMRVTAMPARHGPALVAPLMPQTMGSLLEFPRPDGSNAFRLYISGDTLVFDQIQEIPARYPDIDLALLHLGGTRILGILVTMDAKQGITMLKVIGPRHAIPIHYNDYTVFKSPLEDFIRAVKDAGLESKVSYLRHGDTYDFEASGR